MDIIDCVRHARAWLAVHAIVVSAWLGELGRAIARWWGDRHG